MTEIHQFKSSLDTFEYSSTAYTYIVQIGVWSNIDIDELSFAHLIDLISRTHNGDIYVINKKGFFDKFEIVLGQNIGGSVIDVEDSVSSTSQTDALSANQGKLLNDAIGLKLDASSYNDYYKGTYTTLGNLLTAIPTSTSGSYAIVDTGVGNDAKIYLWDIQDGWVEGSNTGSATTDSLAEGTTNKYFTESRVRATALTAISFVSSLAVTATDTILVAIGKLQAQINSLLDASPSNQGGATYALGDNSIDNTGKGYIRMTSSSANTVEVKTTLVKPVSVTQRGTGTTTLSQGAGVTLNGTLAFSAQHQTKTIIPLGSGVFDIVG